MEIIGRGFLAAHLRSIERDRHPRTTVLAAGVSCASDTSVAQFRREADLLRETAARCREAGRRLVFFSTASSGMYAGSGGAGREDEAVVPQTPYGRHKRDLEEELAASGADHVILRLSHVVGPGQPAHQLLPTLIAQLATGHVTLHRGAARDLIGIDDLVHLVDLLLPRCGPRTTVNVASGAAVPVERIVDHLQARLGLPAERSYVQVRGAHTVDTGRLRRLVPEADLLGFGPDYYRAVLDRYVLPAAHAGLAAQK
ncbi:NAD-dependent epimerase/dehydratase family protein [Streptomyces sp. SID8379]|uniref:NAD-dependent epimerase/dehydratase family protein n=1 Tax=unclassified Streptomyces TaxID=2593676 RepID=UPI00037016A3|nr:MULTISPECIES: NAD-dependent epimerase/dehydratase family protein [unclassified Streptomyces]MYW65857.1 NAD-dependent epimerase/dehydratase family protein [Streptomyces sp. SID8379]